ncbi:tetratricopeptide repeat protein [Roseivirga seohaensis]|uniref:tetratricopeptide repeat protein n=1 Tax=Roseivirga seohaensis TaxID=1914963 RepID=UPI0009EAECFE|nr:tetratricopeptide repeat protein [Roseivirga seohaensis]
MKHKILLIATLFCLHGSLNAQNTLHPSNPNIYFSSGLELLEMEKYSAARDQFERYLAQGDDEIKKADAEYYMAFCALNLDNGDGAQLISQFVRNRPNHPKAAKAYYNLGVVSFKNGDFTTAERYFKLVNSSALNGEERVETNFKIAYSLYALRRYEESVPYFDKAKGSKGPYFADANYYAGYLAYAYKEYDKALVDLKNAGTTEKYKNRVPIMVASAYYQQKRYGELVQYASQFKTAIAENRKLDYLYQIYQMTAESYYNQGQYKESLEYYDLYSQLAQQNVTQETLYRMGFAYYSTGQAEESIEQFKKVALNSDTLAQNASYYLGRLYVEQENFLFAIAAFDKAASLGFNKEIQEEAAFNSAKVNFQAGKYSQSIIALDKFMRNYPTSDYIPEANNLLSEAFLNTNDYSRAITFIERIENKSDRLKEAYQKVTFFKGTEFYNARKYDNAVQLFDKSLQYPIDKDLATATYFWKGEAFATARNYPQAIASYKKVITSGSRNSEYLVKANYGLGYAYYNGKSYTEARTYFKRYVDALENARDKQNYNDALIRLADCYYVDKEYASAITYYDKAIGTNNPNIDYAYFQKGVVYDFEGKPSEAIASLDVVINRFADSRYYDDAIYKKAQIQLEDRQFRNSIQGFNRIIDRLSQSPFIPYAYESRALAYFNLEDYDQAERDYKTILDNYITSSVSNSALLGLQNTLKLQNKTIQFDQYLARYKSAHPENQALENIEFESAKNLFFGQEYSAAIGALEDYRKNYPNSGLVHEAKYYQAESYYRLSDTEKALEMFYEINRDSKITGMDRVFERIGELQLKAGDFKEATNFYGQLEKVAKSKRQENDAWLGLLEAHYQLSEYAQMRIYAKNIITKGAVTQEATDKAQLYLGKAAYAEGNFDEAIDQFLTTLNTAKNQYGAEAQFMVGKIFYQQKQYQQSLNTLFEMNENFSAYDEWLGKAFLLIADNYIALNEIFQAKATVNSIIQYSQLDNIKEDARAKLKQIEKLEAEAPSQEEVNADTTRKGGN